METVSLKVATPGEPVPIIAANVPRTIDHSSEKEKAVSKPTITVNLQRIAELFVYKVTRVQLQYMSFAKG